MSEVGFSKILEGDDDEWFYDFFTKAPPPKYTALSGTLLSGSAASCSSREPAVQKMTAVKSKQPSCQPNPTAQGLPQPTPTAKVPPWPTDSRNRPSSSRTPRQPVCKWRQKAPCDEDVVAVLEEVETAKDMSIDLGPPRAGAMLEHCINCIARRLEQGPTVFKVGITADPIVRFVFYKTDRDVFSHMLLLCVSQEPGYVAMLEAALIREFQRSHRNQGFRNVATGGETCPESGPVYLYVVTRAADVAVRCFR